MWRKRFLLLSIMGLSLVACEPEGDYLRPVDYNLAGYLLSDNSDNYNLRLFGAVLSRSGMDKTLLEQGPFTVLVPSDDAFTAYTGYDEVSEVVAMPLDGLVDLANYHVLDGQYELDKLPFLFNREIRTHGGKPLYVTRWVDVNTQDTVLAINGSIVSDSNILASNGVIRIIDKVLVPNVHSNLADALADDNTLTLFNHAVYKTGLQGLLKGEGPFTVFAPDNAAMATYGFATIQDVDEADPDMLLALVRYHIMRDRRFFNDFVLTTRMNEAGTITAQVEYFGFIYIVPMPATVGKQHNRMLDGNTITFLLGFWENPSFGSGTAMNLFDVTGAELGIRREDVMAGNGVLHVIDRVARNASY